MVEHINFKVAGQFDSVLKGHGFRRAQKRPGRRILPLCRRPEWSRRRNDSIHSWFRSSRLTRIGTGPIRRAKRIPYSGTFLEIQFFPRPARFQVGGQFPRTGYNEYRGRKGPVTPDRAFVFCARGKSSEIIDEPATPLPSMTRYKSFILYEFLVTLLFSLTFMWAAAMKVQWNE